MENFVTFRDDAFDFSNLGDVCIAIANHHSNKTGDFDGIDSVYNWFYPSLVS